LRTSRIASCTSASERAPRPVRRLRMPPIFSDSVSNIAKRFRARGRIALSGVGLRPLDGPVGGEYQLHVFDSARKLGVVPGRVKAQRDADFRRLCADFELGPG